ncbi:MAG: antitoxin [Chloroflexota bacterium]
MITDHIEINPQVMLGKPVIQGTRIPVELILRKLSEGATEADLLDAYPRLTVEDIRAALAYAADALAHEVIILPTAQ